MIRFTVHVSPGSSRREVGGDYDGALKVRVRARAIGGAATKEAIDAVAEAFAVAPSAVWCHSGASSRTKIMAIEGDDDAITQRLEELRGVE